MKLTTRALGPLVLIVPAWLQGCLSAATDAPATGAPITGAPVPGAPGAAGHDAGVGISSPAGAGDDGSAITPQPSSSPVEAGDPVEDATPPGTDAAPVCSRSA